MAVRTRTAESGVVWQESDLLRNAGAAHGFSTRLGGVSRGVYASLNLGHTRGDDPEAVRENYRRFLAATGAGRVEDMVLSHQIHEHFVRPCTEADRGKGLDRPRDYDADGLMTDVPGLPLVIFTADCIPVLLYDPVGRAAAAVHAGWRGTAQAIVRHAVEAMGETYGSQPENLIAAIGPGISECCFLCHEDVPKAMREALGALAEPFIRPAEDGRYHVDLKGINAELLRQAGVERIDISTDCTGCLREKYYNHRSTGPARGSMAAVITVRSTREKKESIL